MIALKRKSTYKSENKKKKTSIVQTESDDMNETEDDGMEDSIIDTVQTTSITPIEEINAPIKRGENKSL